MSNDLLEIAKKFLSKLEKRENVSLTQMRRAFPKKYMELYSNIRSQHEYVNYELKRMHIVIKPYNKQLKIADLLHKRLSQTDQGRKKLRCFYNRACDRLFELIVENPEIEHIGILDRPVCTGDSIEEVPRSVFSKSPYRYTDEVAKLYTQRDHKLSFFTQLISDLKSGVNDYPDEELPVVNSDFVKPRSRMKRKKIDTSGFQF